MITKGFKQITETLPKQGDWFEQKAYGTFAAMSPFIAFIAMQLSLNLGIDAEWSIVVLGFLFGTLTISSHEERTSRATRFVQYVIISLVISAYGLSTSNTMGNVAARNQEPLLPEVELSLLDLFVPSAHAQVSANRVTYTVKETQTDFIVKASTGQTWTVPKKVASAIREHLRQKQNKRGRGFVGFK